MTQQHRDASGIARLKAIVIYSGGMDSYTVLHHALCQGYEVHALSFDYGQRHSRELNVARDVCQRLGIAHQIVDIRAIHSLIDNSALTDASRDLPGGDYASDNMVATLVPNRNMILLSLAIAQAVNIGAELCFYGAHGGDHVLYPDCRPEFVERMNDVAAIANFETARIEAPYLHVDKAAILADGLAMGLDYGETWTCYLGEEFACGACGSCRERLAAFAANGVSDPVRYSHRCQPGTNGKGEPDV
ncbi:preQ(0) biosynthesis protein QueC [Modicisalibacter muralis]|uniref:7-cyano-7-deazaguanine synthase n=1 Tax=Modicisalibacter muralis TaxID=119000 RepID=A0A1G9FS00_9GAMM|nr:7-cyano-7-deazaguanine synthase QueC [Halomonas muralis]SDK91112.1 preQ(0) biosynthesis protein QueC [Halomonas muralis]